MHLRMFLLLVILSIQPARAGSFEILLPDFGWGRTAEGCVQDLMLVADAFAAKSNAVILGVDCVPSRLMSPNQDGKISYAANKSVVVTTSAVAAGYGPVGYYRSASECFLGLNKELGVFRSVTGLEPFVKYCYQSNYYGAPLFQSRLDAVGMSKVQKFSTYASWHPKLLDPATALASLVKMGESHGLTVVQSIIVPDVTWKAGLGYYADKQLHLHSEAALSWITPEECHRVTGKVLKEWSGDTPLAFACGEEGKLFQGVYWWFWPEYAGAEFSKSIYSIAYSILEQCEGDQERVRQALTQAGTKVLGLMCGYDQGKIRMLGFEKVR